MQAQIEALLLQNPLIAPLIYIGLFWILPIFFFPVPILALVAGNVFGLVWGSIYTFIGAVLNCATMFLLARWLFFDKVSAYVKTKLSPELYHAIFGNPDTHLDILLIVLRLIPLVPYNLINLGFGLTGISFKRYMLFSALGIIPGTIAFIAVGSSSRDFGSLNFILSITLLVVLIVVSSWYGKREHAKLKATYIKSLRENPSSILSSQEDLSKLSVIIPVYNEESNIPGLLANLETLIGKKYAEFIFVDGESSDNTVALLKENGCRVIHESRGRGAQLRAGANVAKGQTLFFLHADSRLEPTALLDVIKHLKKYDAGFFSLAFDRKTPALLAIQWLSNMRAKYRGLIYGDQGLFIKREAYEQLGGFEDIPLFEDYEFAKKMRSGGLSVKSINEPIVTSARKYRRGPLKTLMFHFKMRRRYNAGESVEKLTKMYQEW